MLTLFHHPMSSGSRYVRLILGEYGVEAELIEERPWSRRREFLALNPAGTLPVLLAENDLPVVGPTVIAEYLDETRGALKRSRRLLPESPMERAEVRRLVDWFLLKFENEVTRHIARERVFKLQMAAEMGGSAPDSTAIRAARTNIRQHMKYIDWLAATRDWLGGAHPSYADTAAAACISVLDYLGEIEWSETKAARDWYARMKSRPAFRPLLSDRVRGLAPVAHYGDLDF
ncbi:glutathione S-transferase family protein [Ochrobactrum pecoris]|uniref:Glutathione S-transferase n=2 Tax=Brucella/Ochrobactrum group TaxID=2826938 RepID=A0A5C5CHQ8_9HYPH|nr:MULTISPECIES: glutathione S-transferase family protein [Brucella/Ochrobactrum group]MBB4095023.1 glutathione S-transferase [Brucella pecoris]NKW79679.1 glutathione S-transferase family protein [Brucella pecoris]PQZ30516.1 glutathione S-transferase [Ochrobactrum vermis]TNV10923.1 glutathione S-transferase family protein [Brucella pecoris]